MSNSNVLSDGLVFLVDALAAAVRLSGLSESDLAISEVRRLCRLMHLADVANEPRALQPAGTELYGVLKGFSICGFITNEQLQDFGDQIYRPAHPYQGVITPAREIPQ
ncbi:hypothetical protein V0M98_37505 (plasmid) [Pseudomonas silesiensis]|uniref:hypothetical protein n=1 Tax=Pseudomonas silesiensis TaxID=1853130 RepID=UPI0030CD1DA2